MLEFTDHFYELRRKHFDLTEPNCYILGESPQRRIYGHFRNNVFYSYTCALNKKTENLRRMNLSEYSYQFAYDAEEKFHMIFDIKRKKKQLELFTK